MSQPYIEPCDDGLIEAQPCPLKAGREIGENERNGVLAACVLASSMAFIDGSALTVALPALRADLGADLAGVQWVLNGYVLALASLTLVGGAMADVYGKARMVGVGCGLFGLASIACALAPSTDWLIIARVAQGVSAAILTPASLALIGAAFPKDERSRAIGIWAAASALTTAGGPILGGWLTETFGWQAIFWINPPIALAAVAMLVAFAPADLTEDRRFDLTGAAIIAAALLALAWALSTVGPGEAHDGLTRGAMLGAETGVALILGLAGIAAFIWWEARTAEPMMPLRLFARRGFTGLNLTTLLLYAALSVMFFLVPFELVEQRNLSASSVGLVFLPFTLGVGLLSRAFGGLADRVGARPLLIAGAIGSAVAFALFALLSSASLWISVVLPMAVLGVSFAVLVAPLTASVMSSVDEHDEGLASGINNTASRIAQMIGVALAAGLGSFTGGYVIGMAFASVAALAGAAVVASSVFPVSDHEAV